MDPEPGDDDFFPLVLVRFDENLTPVDTAKVPRYQGERLFFEKRGDDGFMRASVPHTPSLTWRLSRSGDLWFVLTGDYEIYQRTFGGDTLRVIRKEFAPLPVTAADLDEARENLEWFTRQGGEIDLSKVPDHKPGVRSFFFGRDGALWVEPVTTVDRQNRVFELFDREGRFLGEVLLPFPLQASPPPVFLGDFMYALTRDELEVPYIVKARIGGPITDTGNVAVGGGSR